jgi:hypothetical protein
MKIKNSFPKENDIIDNIRISKGKSVEKKIRKSSENNLDYSNYKYLDDTNIKIQNNYYCISNDLEKSIEKEDTTSKDSKDNTLSGESLYTLSNFSLSFLVNEKKKFKNLKIEEKISTKILKKKE